MDYSSITRVRTENGRAALLLIRFLRFLEEQVDVAQMTQKLLVKVTSSSSKLIKFGDENMDLLISDVLPRHSKLLLVGSTQEDVEMAQTLKGDRLLLGFEEETRRAKIRNRYDDEDATKNDFLQPRFGRVESLQQFQTPSPRQALALLRRLANDPGIRGIMDKHDYRVGLLNEMPPEGLVGVDQVCILGYNSNKGQSITLRLRTDNLKGFRKYLVIRDTCTLLSLVVLTRKMSPLILSSLVIHELCHNEFSEHDSRFWGLFYQLKREIVAFDQAGKGNIVGGPRSAEMGHFDDEDEGDDLMDVDGAGHVLDPHHHHHPHADASVSAATLAREAAEKRFAAGSSSSPSSSTSTPADRIERPIDPTPAPIIPGLPPMEAPTHPIPSVAPAPVSVDPTIWICVCTCENPLDAKTCLACGTISPAFEASLPRLELDGLNLASDPQVELANKLERSLDDFLRPLSATDRYQALTTLAKIYSNILRNPTEQRFRSISMTSKTFLSAVRSHLF